ncbi:polysaccharide deacetylase family protein [Aminobacter sp. SR38]|jgi:GT2 family glycosyltransferase/peptidoglycan/xylan/chitin deacetylase (PgdA/CDA1 family)|uniref:polysaccharide deacetylase family protein n=1 Tax=Aminobacter sp. SR38 TaxID=2774562 RepID=UPI00177F5993|nr:polysaccharide deacetylase family protein [Aminobacter sp. SR38]QOF70863.1 polysaccharide deacetylase family protein [Aminobacter sp. SR38]
MSVPEFHPIKILDVDVCRPMNDVPMFDAATDQRYGGVFCLIRRQGRPVTIMEFDFDEDVLTTFELRRRISENQAVQDSTFQHDAPLPRKDGPFASVVIATRDRAESLARCLDSLLLQTYQPFEIVVVDNAPSSSQTADLIARRYGGARAVRYVREDVPGLGRAHNAGLANLSSELALFTDDDVVVDPNWVAAMAANFDRDGRVGCVTGLILPAELDTRAQFWTERHGGFGKGFARKVFDLAGNRPAGSLFPFTAGQFGSGANMAFRTEALRQIGGFDSALGAGTLARGGDDLASFYAVVQAGFQLVYDPRALLWHHHRRGEDGMRRQAFGYGMGLGAYLTKVVIDEPAAALRLARAMPAGIAHMAGPTSPKNQRLPGDYPSNLVWRERLGIAAGVPGYLRSRYAAARSPSSGIAPSANGHEVAFKGGSTAMRPSVPILVYHSIDTSCAAPYRRWMMLPDDFERHMQVLAEGGFRPVTISALATIFREKRPLPPRTVCITFDDGLQDFLIGAMPILERHGFAATLYVVSGLVGKTSQWLASSGEGDRPMLGWGDLRALACEGIEIGAHTVSHPQLDILSASDAAREIHDSKLALEHGLKRPVHSFAYPHGYSSRTTRALVRGAGFTSACRVRHAMTTTTEDPYTLSRIVMTSEIGPAELRRMLTQPVLPVAPPADRLVASGWRMVRRFQHMAHAGS